MTELKHEIVEGNITGRLKFVEGLIKTLSVEVDQLVVLPNGEKTKAGTTWISPEVHHLKALEELAMLGAQCKNGAQDKLQPQQGVRELEPANQEAEHSGGNVNYYVVYIAEPKREEHAPYHAECEDIMLYLGMTFSEGCAFKALWRSAAARTLGKLKKGGDPIYDAEKVIHYGKLTLKERRMRERSANSVPVGMTLFAHEGSKILTRRQSFVVSPNGELWDDTVPPSQNKSAAEGGVIGSVAITRD